MACKAVAQYARQTLYEWESRHVSGGTHHLAGWLYPIIDAFGPMRHKDRRHSWVVASITEVRTGRAE